MLYLYHPLGVIRREEGKRRKRRGFFSRTVKEPKRITSFRKNSVICLGESVDFSLPPQPKGPLLDLETQLLPLTEVETSFSTEIWET